MWSGSWLIRIAAFVMLLGIVIFSGLIYAEILGAPESLGEIVPLGGACFMVAWLMVALAIAIRPAPVR